ncbi:MULTISPECIES: apotyrosinase chaperone MelC1 [Streptomyces]|uniref:Tyrosinase cofactor n=1 Tax=Streptomyces chengmaiensis TaxID=3040919 RepID=A0ABT6HLT5_9ACTN|nr:MULTISPECIES: tyrosinase cofactor [Streptomyces]MDH2388834.1 tyrosinase cofactor [Streptomyces chengmaiensis]WRQ78134.1 tyrosinase cofactor [Streptomyces sp. MUM 178J]
MSTTSSLSRRSALGATLGVFGGLALAGAAHASADRARDGHRDHPALAGHDAMPESFDEIYEGRRIQGRPASHGGGSPHGGHHSAGYQVHVDGRELHVMRNADGTWISVVNHYETFANPRAVARAAVVELQGSTLAPFPA